MNKLYLLDLLEYNCWANGRIYASAATLSDEQFERTIISSFPSVKTTILHIWDAEYIWNKRLLQQSITDFPGKSFKGSSQELIAGANAQSVLLLELLKSQDEVWINELLAYTNIKGEHKKNLVMDILPHLTIHASYHRGQLVTMLRQLGLESIPGLDFILYKNTAK